MNSPIANKNKSRFQKKLIVIHHKYAQNKRSVILGEKIAEIIKSEVDCSKKVDALDFGCGDMEIASNIHQIIPEIDWTGTDIHVKLDSENFPFKYLQYQDCKLPFRNKSFDIVVMSDVLHHVIEKEQSVAVLECLRVGNKVIIKDVIEKGFISRIILILMDIFGNWAYGVRIPTRYFSKKRFEKLCKDNSISCEIKVSKVELYNHLPSVIKLISPPDLHFIAVLTKKEN